MDIWIINCLALDDEYNYTEVPNTNFDIDTVPLGKGTSAPSFQDHDSVSTFQSKVSFATARYDTEGTENARDQDTSDASSQATVLTSTPAKGKSPHHPEAASTVITLDSSSVGQDISGITEGESTVLLLEKQLMEMSKEFKTSMQQWESRQTSMDKNYKDLFSLIQLALRVSTPPPEEKNKDSPAGSQIRTPSGKDNLPTVSDEDGDPLGVAGGGS